MGQYVFEASKYPVGTKLTELGWAKQTLGPGVGVPEVYEYATGRFAWRNPTLENKAFYYLDDMPDQFEMLLLRDFTANELGHTYTGSFARIEDSGSTFSVAQFRYLLKASDDSEIKSVPDFSGQGGNTTKDIFPPTLDHDLATGMRIKMGVGLDLKAWVWGGAVGALEAAEPVDTVFEGNRGTRNASKKVLAHPVNASTTPWMYSTISIGTDGDVAPYTAPALTVATPNAPTITNITGNSATVNF